MVLQSIKSFFYRNLPGSLVSQTPKVKCKLLQLRVSPIHEKNSSAPNTVMNFRLPYNIGTFPTLLFMVNNSYKKLRNKYNRVEYESTRFTFSMVKEKVTFI